MKRKRSLKELYRLAKGEGIGCCDTESPVQDGCSKEKAIYCCKKEEEKYNGCP